jgi:isopentenyl-diphosphate delta-isomerase
VLEAAVKGTGDVEKVLRLLIEELRDVMFLVGAENVKQLAKVPLVVTGGTAEWLRARGFNVDKYARRGAQ